MRRPCSSLLWEVSDRKDYLPVIADILGEIADVELSFADHDVPLPCSVRSELGNSSAVILSGRDRYSIITMQTDIYAGTAENVRGLALQVNAALAERGLKRSFSQLITEEKVPRMCMRYRFGVDEATGRTVSL